jgi:hypothetical protein
MIEGRCEASPKLLSEGSPAAPRLVPQHEPHRGGRIGSQRGLRTVITIRLNPLRQLLDFAAHDRHELCQHGAELVDGQALDFADALHEARRAKLRR